MIDLQHVNVTGDNGRLILDDLSLTVHSGEHVVITGPSGGGKSTALRAIVGLAPMESGTIEVDANVLSRHSVCRIRRTIAYVDQEPVLGSDRTTVREALLKPFRWRANRHAEPGEDAIRAALEQVGLTNGMLSQTLALVSGGEKQRLAIVRAHLLNRPVLIADEPTSALDAEHRRLVTDFLRDMAGTALVVSHDEEVMNRATRVLRLAAGRLTEATPDEFTHGERRGGGGGPDG